jgi:DNA polymerase V
MGRKLAHGPAVFRWKRPRRLSKMRVDGDSMRDAGILDGDLLVVDRAAKPDNGCVVVVALNGEYTVKRLRRCPDCVWLEPANPRYQPIRVSIGEDLHVFGVVKHAIHTLR